MSNCRARRQRPAPSAMRMPLALARDGSREQEIGDIGADDEQHEYGHGHQQLKRAEEIISDAVVLAPGGDVR